jgi:hypothetical protein
MAPVGRPAVVQRQLSNRSSFLRLFKRILFQGTVTGFSSIRHTPPDTDGDGHHLLRGVRIEAICGKCWLPARTTPRDPDACPGAGFRFCRAHTSRRRTGWTALRGAPPRRFRGEVRRHDACRSPYGRPWCVFAPSGLPRCAPSLNPTSELPTRPSLICCIYVTPTHFSSRSVKAESTDTRTKSKSGHMPVNRSQAA